MEYANEQEGGTIAHGQIRSATRKDARGITYLLRNAPYIHLHMDWRVPAEWIGEPVFLVQPNERPSHQIAKASRLMGHQVELQGCLAITADPHPAAWVRVAAVGKVTKLEPVLLSLFQQAFADLRAVGITQVGWLTAEKWPIAFLPALGFAPISEIESYFKPDLTLPTPSRPWPEVLIRPVETADFPALAALEAEVFAPLWRHSAETLALAWRESVTFDVMEENGRIIGFQFSTSSRDTAHLVRMTLTSDVQGRGYGSALLDATLKGYQKKRLKNVTLNTQTENKAARRLYEKFGFTRTGQRLPIWAISL